MDIAIALVKAVTVFAVGVGVLSKVMEKTDHELLPSCTASLMATMFTMWCVSLV